MTGSPEQIEASRFSCDTQDDCMCNDYDLAEEKPMTYHEGDPHLTALEDFAAHMPEKGQREDTRLKAAQDLADGFMLYCSRNNLRVTSEVDPDWTSGLVKLTVERK
jgi:hypothetical protein